MPMRLNIALAADEDDIEEVGDEVTEGEEEKAAEPVTTTHDVFVRALKESGFSIVSDPGKLGKSVIVSLGNEKDFIDAVASKLEKKFSKVKSALKDLGGDVELVPGKGDRTIKYWGSVTIEGKQYSIDFTYRVGQGIARMAKG